MTNQRANYCTLCQLIPLILGLAGLYGWYLYTKESKAEFIENDLTIKSASLLTERQVGGVTVNMDGRDATLTGTVESVQRSQSIETIVSSLSGIRMVDNQLNIASAPVVEPETTPEPTPEPAPEMQAEADQKQESKPEIALASETEVKTEAQAPLPESAVSKMLQTLNLSGITFLFDSDELTEQGISILNDVVKVLTKHPEFNVVIQGYTDSAGDDSFNLDLSQRRAQSVMNFLNNQGISENRMSAIGYGESEPIASNDSAEGRAINRRIEFAVTRRL